jgi:hypothetical protein
MRFGLGVKQKGFRHNTLALTIAEAMGFRIHPLNLSEIPLYFIFRYNGDSVDRYRRYGCIGQTESPCIHKIRFHGYMGKPL